MLRFAKNKGHRPSPIPTENKIKTIESDKNQNNEPPHTKLSDLEIQEYGKSITQWIKLTSLFTIGQIYYGFSLFNTIGSFENFDRMTYLVSADNMILGSFYLFFNPKIVKVLEENNEFTLKMGYIKSISVILSIFPLLAYQSGLVSNYIVMVGIHLLKYFK